MNDKIVPIGSRSPANADAAPPRGPTHEELQPIYDRMRRGLRLQLIDGHPELETPEERAEREEWEALEREEAERENAQRDERRLAHDAMAQRVLPLPLSSDPALLERLNNGYIRGVDKWFRQFAGFASSLEEFDGEMVSFRVEAAAGCRLSHSDIIARVAPTWRKYVVGLVPARRFCVRIFTLQQGGVGGVVTPSEYSREDDWVAAMAEILERMELAKEELKRPGYPYVEYRGDYDNPGPLTVIHHPDFKRGGP